MSQHQIQLLLVAMIGFGVLVVIGFTVQTYRYRRLGYPPAPEWFQRIRSSDDIELVCDKMESAFREGFQVRHRDQGRLILEKSFANPPCVMTVEVTRFALLRWHKVSVRCPNNRSLNWSSTSGRNW